MATNLPAVREEYPVAPPMPRLEIGGMEGLSQQDLIIPRWNVMQGMSQFDDAEKHPGEFRRNIDAEFRKALDVVILAIQPARLKYETPDPGSALECMSRDGVHGSKFGLCARCRFNRWYNRDLAERLKAGEKLPKCDYGYNLIILDDLELESPALLGAMGTSVRPVKVLATNFAMRRRPTYGCITRIETVLQRNDLGKFYVLKFTPGEALDKARVQQYAELSRLLQSQNVRSADDDEDAEGVPSSVVPDDNPLNQPDEDGEELPF